MVSRLYFLGTGGSLPTVSRGQPSIFLNHTGDKFLFDCGEGTQRQMRRFGTGFAISDIFITRWRSDHIFGIPGLLQSMDFNGRREPITIHVPSGSRSQSSNFISVDDLSSASQEGINFSIRINEAVPNSTVVDADIYEIRAFETDTQNQSVGYLLVEDDRKGRFDRERAEELGVPVGPKFGQLHSGHSVELEDGSVIHSEQVVGPRRLGRRIVYTGDTRPSDTVVEVSEDADLLVHDAAFTDSNSNRAQNTGHSTAKEAAEIAARAGAKRLALFHFAPRYQSSATHVQEAEELVDNTDVIAPDDGFDIDIPHPDSSNRSKDNSTISSKEQPSASDSTSASTQISSIMKPQQTADKIDEATEGEKSEPGSEGATPTLDELRERAEEEAREEVEVSMNDSTQRSAEYSRSQAIRRYVKERANGYCEGCEEPAPFVSKSGKPYLHAHHVFELSDGGSDTPDTVIALCPNCHYRVHHGQDGEKYNNELYEFVQQIEKSERWNHNEN